MAFQVKEQSSGRWKAMCVECGADYSGYTRAHALRNARNIHHCRLESSNDMDCREGMSSTKCRQCGKAMNPVEVMLGPVCGLCCRENHKRFVGGN